ELPAAAALVAWADLTSHSSTSGASSLHWACVVRKTGLPHWVELPGNGPRQTWIRTDERLIQSAREMLSQRPNAGTMDLNEGLVPRLFQQRLPPLLPYLRGLDDLPAVEQLIVLPPGQMAGLPVEALTNAYTTSYAPSATMYVRLKQRPRPTTTA